MINKYKKNRVSDLNIETLKSSKNIVIQKEDNIIEYFLNKELPLKKTKIKITLKWSHKKKSVINFKIF